MNTRQSRKFIMYLGMGNFLNRNTETTDSLPNFKELFKKFLLNSAKIEQLSSLQEVGKLGVIVEKGRIHNNLFHLAYDIANKLYSYALLTNNISLSREIHFSETELSHLKDVKLISALRLIYDRANEHINNLQSYDILPSDILSLKEQTDLFLNVIPSTREIQASSAQKTKQLASLFSETDDILDKIDRILEIIRLTNPEFYSAYHCNRKIIYSTSKLSLTGRITCAASGEALKGAKITFVPCGEDGNPLAKASKPLVKKSATKGIFKVKHMPEGTYIVIIEKTGYVTIKQTIVITNGETTVFEVALTQSQTLA